MADTKISALTDGTTPQDADQFAVARSTSNVKLLWSALKAAVYAPGGTDVAVTDGGTGASTAATGRANLGAAPADATYIMQTANSETSAEQALSSLSTGLVKVTTTTGVLSTAAAGTDYAKAEADLSFTDITTNNVTSTKHGFAPKSPADATQFLNGALTPAFAAVKDSDLSTSDVTTNNVTSTKHGFAPKSPADAAQFLNGAATPAFAAVKDSDLSTSDITTNNASTTKHGFLPKLDNNSAHFLDGTGAWSTPSGGSTELDYVEYTSGTISVTATSDATAQTYVSGTSKTYAASRIRIECFSPLGEIRHTAACALVFNLYDGSTDLGELGEIENNTNQNGASMGGPLHFVRYLTPTAGTHQYILKVWKSAGTANVYGSAGGTATLMPAFIRVSLA